MRACGTYVHCGFGIILWQQPEQVRKLEWTFCSQLHQRIQPRLKRKADPWRILLKSRRSRSNARNQRGLFLVRVCHRSEKDSSAIVWRCATPQCARNPKAENIAIYCSSQKGGDAISGVFVLHKVFDFCSVMCLSLLMVFYPRFSSQPSL
ncbi:hypothetical protein BC830DRAFT_622568 [Chytriomyces sp. MP71]|nr:hypothetical protein BC830DRAFT_622568 [Chytriomyces sp. MP71]